MRPAALEIEHVKQGGKACYTQSDPDPLLAGVARGGRPFKAASATAASRIRRCSDATGDQQAPATT